MIIRSRAPLRVGLAGGGTDVSPYSDIYGGAILNAAISLYAYATIEPLDNGKLILAAEDKGITLEMDAATEIPINGTLDLHKGVYNRIVKDFAGKPLSCKLTTYVDAPPGSGLGSSSTLVVAILGAFAEWLSIPLGEYDMAHLAYEVERIDLAMAGGKQDQYAATFGGFNFMEFSANDKVIVNPLRIRKEYLDELESRIVLFYTETSRLSSAIIEKQTINVQTKEGKALEAMHKLKEQAVRMKEALLTGNLDAIGDILDFGWQYKKQMADGITNPLLDEIYDEARNAGASGGKISGAGGGGFMMFYCPATTRYAVAKALSGFGGEPKRFNFTGTGLTTWSV